METGTALIDLSPFTKIDVRGPGVCEALNSLCTAQMDVPPGWAVYAQILNDRGGIEMDVTISRLGADHFHITSGAATRARDMNFLRRHLSESLQITDFTEEFCTVGVMGAGSAEILSVAFPSGKWAGAPLGQIQIQSLGEHQIRATRLSFVGEYGWELTLPNASASDVFSRLRSAGAAPLGHFALDGCRLEKGFKHWGHDLGPEITPLEAGLGFTIDWTKDFRGRAALLQQKDEGVRQRLVLLHVPGNALLLHDEPVYEDGVHVGYTTSGARGPRTGMNLCFALVRKERGETPLQTRLRPFRVRVVGQDHEAHALRQAPFDPTNERMRG